jgi:hypothetical protein
MTERLRDLSSREGFTGGQLRYTFSSRSAPLHPALVGSSQQHYSLIRPLPVATSPANDLVSKMYYSRPAMRSVVCSTYPRTVAPDCKIRRQPRVTRLHLMTCGYLARSAIASGRRRHYQEPKLQPLQGAAVIRILRGALNMIGNALENVLSSK